ncbi:HD domain-containing protein [Thermosipho ferrireducens]|uniref:HD domain-containing protein n=1 Tax=Thermosipho ferrireducens TaxID=2571116 RepID=A0ABX7S897_9BACT|nr:HD domain-containing protein [Thermosipho ferrireducens]QTA37335.1 HD domain-containing protein [Thermosipho ferrireducens]
MYYKVARDPVYSEIFMYPLEILAADTNALQRLRYLSQLVGAEYVYPGATHTRFSHSLGTMHIAGMYAEHLYDQIEKVRILRLAGLLHDIGHGPFSHQFDDVVYKRMQLDEGHDEYRKRILLEYMPGAMEKIYNRSHKKLQKAVLEDIENTLGKCSDDIKKDFKMVMESIVEVFEGEEKGTVDFGLIQGPLGADRLDFVLRDSYYAGTRGFGTGALDRLIRNSSIYKSENKELLTYNIKVIDEIYTILFGRFMMYKNVYFHKTSRAADLMIQELLDFSYRPLNLPNRVKNLETFMELTDQRIINEIEVMFENIVREYTVDSFEITKEKILNYEIDLQAIELDVVMAYEIIQKLKSRELWKTILEAPFSVEGIDPSVASQGLAMDILQKIRLRLEKAVEIAEEEDKEELSMVLSNFDEIFRVDTPYKLTLVHPEEFLKSNIYIYDSWKNKILSFDEYVRQYPAYDFMSSNLIQIVRVYVTKDIRDLLEKYNIVPKLKTELTTRW